MIKRALVAAAAVVVAIGLGATASATTGWTSVTAPNPAGNAQNYLTSVSCPTASFCMAVGVNAVNPGLIKPLVEMYDGKHWTLGSPTAIGSDTYFEGVDCASATFCTVVGGDAAGPLAERWNGHSWRVEAAVRARYGGGFAAVSCPSTQSCFAVGYQYFDKQAVGTKVLAERWEGPSSGWSVTSSPSVAPYQSAELSAISCTSTTRCVAAGGLVRDLSGDGFYNLIETWNGKTWSKTAVPSPAGISGLSDIACRSRSWCLAVGKGGGGPGDPAALLLKDGKWAATTVSTAGGEFTSVACRSDTSCIATGQVSADTGALITPLVEHWNGSAWAKRTVSEPASQDSALNGATCVSASKCFAVGFYTPSTGSDVEKVLVEQGSSR